MPLTVVSMAPCRRQKQMCLVPRSISGPPALQPAPACCHAQSYVMNSCTGQKEEEHLWSHIITSFLFLVRFEILVIYSCNLIFRKRSGMRTAVTAPSLFICAPNCKSAESIAQKWFQDVLCAQWTHSCDAISWVRPSAFGVSENASVQPAADWSAVAQQWHLKQIVTLQMALFTQSSALRTR